MIRTTDRVTPGTNNFLARIRSQSYILNSQNRNSLTGIFNESSIQDLQTQILLIEGSTIEEHEGEYFDDRQKKWIPAYLPARRADLAGIEKEFENYVQMQLNSGNQAPTEWPDHLLKKREETEARIAVYQEELTWLREKLASAETEKEEEETKPQPRKFWGSGQLSNGVLVSIGGFTVKPNGDGILCINDKRCPFDGFFVWRFKSEICLPINREENYRFRQATKKALETGNPREAPTHVQTPIWNKETDEISYPGYSKNWVKKP